MNRKEQFIFITVIVVLFVIIIYFYVGTGSWHQVAVFSGATEGGQYPFKIEGDKFRLTYSVALDDRYLDLLTLFVITSDSLERWNHPPYEVEEIIDTEKRIGKTKGAVDITVPLFNESASLTYGEYELYQTVIKQIILLDKDPLQGLWVYNKTTNEYDIIEYKIDAKIKNLLSAAVEQEYENTGELPNPINESRIKSLGERKKLRNDYTEFFYTYESATETSTSYAGAGEYYLMVDAYMATGWTVTIEDHY